MSNTKRIAKNTLMLYFRQILIMLVSLYTVRVVLEVLGVEDYGIYNVVAGIVTMFSFLSSAMATASQRYFSFDLGKNDQQQLKKTFGVTLSIYLLLILIVVVLAETIGLWFIHTKLVVPPDRVIAARWIYQFSILSLALTIYTAPYMALIIAHENMNVYAYISIIEVILKLGVVFIIPFFKIDTLIIYGFLLMLTVFINTSLYRIVCKIKYPESKVQLQFDRKLSREILSYTGWNVFGASVGIFKFQAVNILLNQFFSPIVITARSIASQVNSAVVSFAQNFSTAVRPQIIKSYAQEKFSEMNNLVFQSSKLTFYLMFIFVLPLYLEMPFVLKLWLKEIPEYAILFTQLALIDALIDSISFPIMTAAQATGKIKLYQAIVGGILLLNLPISFVFLLKGFSPQIVFYVAISLTFIAFISRLLIIKKLIYFSVRDFLRHVFIPLLICSFISYFVMSYLRNLYTEGYIRLFAIIVLSSLIITSLMSFIVLNSCERKKVIGFIANKIIKDKSK